VKNAFSLIELVVVLVIIGLIVDGITSGQNLIRSAQLQSVITDVKKYEAAVAAFQERYFQLPGDMSNATDFWGAAHTTASTCYTTASTGEETCNGDGNGSIYYRANAFASKKLI
jgi:prepilin-type N-terminal cleavage/methylation domain-containing protein